MKRLIDERNAIRHKLIDEIDVCLSAPRQGQASTPEHSSAKYSETPGELCDRLLVLDLKIEHLMSNAADGRHPQSTRMRCIELADNARLWREYLQGILAMMDEDLRSGGAQFPPRAEYKLYNDPELNPYMRAE
jgi:hypothetical protein